MTSKLMQKLISLSKEDFESDTLGDNKLSSQNLLEEFRYIYLGKLQRDMGLIYEDLLNFNQKTLYTEVLPSVYRTMYHKLAIALKNKYLKSPGRNPYTLITNMDKFVNSELVQNEIRQINQGLSDFNLPPLNGINYLMNTLQEAKEFMEKHPDLPEAQVNIPIANKSAKSKIRLAILKKIIKG